LEVRRLANPDTVAEARELAAREGWEHAFADALARASRAIAELDAGGVPALPVPLPALPSLLDGWRHAGHLLGAGDNRGALREVALRPALVAAKLRHRRPAVRWPARARLVGVAGPDGSGKSTLAAGLARRGAPGGGAAPTLYLYWCAVCRPWRGR